LISGPYKAGETYTSNGICQERQITGFLRDAVVNGTATILMFVFINPQMSVITDDVIEGKISEPHFRRAVVWLVGSRLAGTVLAQLLLIPAAMLIVAIAENM
jgi:Alternate to MurJ